MLEVTNVLGESRQSRQRGCATQISRRRTERGPRKATTTSPSSRELVELAHLACWRKWGGQQPHTQPWGATSSSPMAELISIGIYIYLSRISNVCCKSGALCATGLRCQIHYWSWSTLLRRCKCKHWAHLGTLVRDIFEPRVRHNFVSCCYRFKHDPKCGSCSSWERTRTPASLRARPSWPPATCARPWPTPGPGP